MSRRIAIACAALLATAVIASGSANAQPTTAGTEVTTTPAVVINEIGVDMFSFSTGVNGTFIELKNTTGDPVLLLNYTLEACNTSNGHTTMVAFDSTDVVPSGGFFIIGNSTYQRGFGTPPRDKAFNVVVDQFLEQAGGGMELTDFGTSTTQNVKWGSPAFDCAGFDDAGVNPDDDNSLQLNTAPPPVWCALPPTPKATNGSC